MFTLCSLESIRRNVEKRSITYLYQIQQNYPVILMLAYFKMFLR